MDKKTSDRPFWRQGDIFFVKLDREPDLEGAKAVKTGVIARGETTGHAHRVSPSSLADGAALMLLGREMFLKTAEAGATIVHEEHGPVALPAGAYAVVNQQEFDGLRWRTVLD